MAGAEYGSGSSRDWAAKGPMLLVNVFQYFFLRSRVCRFIDYISTFCCQGVKAVIAKSFERIHRSNLVGMGIIPLCFKPGEDADTLGLTGHERYTIDLPQKVSDLRPGQDVKVITDDGKTFTCVSRFDTEVCNSVLLYDLHALGYYTQLNDYYCFFFHLFSEIFI